MPYINLRDSVKLFFEIHGEGFPLAMIEGWGYSQWMWFKQINAFSKEYSCIVFDNRGVGLSDKPDKPYSISLFAEDLGELLDFIGVDRAHILGVSMGGFIAQEFALRQPRRVKSLVLVSTHFGGEKATPTPKETMNAILSIREEELGVKEALRRKMSFAFNPYYIEEHPGEIDQIISWRIEEAQPRYAWLRQAEAVQSFSLGEDVSRIRAPTLIVAGTNDRVVPYQNAELLLETIPNSRLVLFEGGSHLIFIENAYAFNKVVMDFLSEVDEGIFNTKMGKIALNVKG
ncbi:MAG: alpha/beta fold hydrolase [Candidatus Jordarchaeum sp.]|uniref:alpha/beta fold hydrolase n=1 Tax=Candidatus Jordarchaeum sp. TaxID=2823881 RepID=UPI004049D5CB